MKVTPIMIFIASLLSIGCARVTSKNVSKVDRGDTKVPELNVPKLLECRKQLKDRVVTIAGFYVSNFEGDSIRHIKDHDFSVRNNSVQVPDYGGHPVKIENGEVFDSPHSVDWRNGQAVLLTGIFRIGDWTTHQQMTLKNVALVQAQYLEAVSVNDPRWQKAYVR